MAPTISIILSGRWNDPDPEAVRDLDSIAIVPFHLLVYNVVTEN